MAIFLGNNKLSLKLSLNDVSDIKMGEITVFHKWHPFILKCDQNNTYTYNMNGYTEYTLQKLTDFGRGHRYNTLRPLIDIPSVNPNHKLFDLPGDESMHIKITAKLQNSHFMDTIIMSQSIGEIKYGGEYPLQFGFAETSIQFGVTKPNFDGVSMYIKYSKTGIPIIATEISYG